MVRAVMVLVGAVVVGCAGPGDGRQRAPVSRAESVAAPADKVSGTPGASPPDSETSEQGTRAAAARDAGAAPRTVDAGIQTLHFEARIEAVRPIPVVYDRRAIPVAVDPRFELTLQVVKAEPDHAWLAPSSTYAFLIHSPARMFAGTRTADLVGATLAFEVQVESLPSGGARWRGLRVVAPQGP